MQIEIKITQKRAELQGSCVLVCGNSGDTVKFIFDNEWGQYSNKTARFAFTRDGERYYTDVLFEGSVCEIPMLSGIDFVEVGVYAGNLSTSTPAKVPTKKSILCKDGKYHEPPPEDVYDQILESVANKLSTTGGTVTGDYYKDGNVFIHEGNLDKIEPHVQELVDEQLAEGKYINEDNLGVIEGHASLTAKATGHAITIDSSKAPLQGLKLYGKTTQNGTPTPDAPVPLVSAGEGGNFKFEVFGKNLCDHDIQKATNNSGLSITPNDDKSITIMGTATAQVTLWCYNILENLKVGETYIAGDCTGVKFVENGVTSYKGIKKPILITENVTEVRLYIQVNSGVTINKTFYPMICHTNFDYNTYEPYNREYAPFPYTLRSVGDVKDELNFDGEIYDYFGKGVHIQRCVKLTEFTFSLYAENTFRAWKSSITVGNTGMCNRYTRWDATVASMPDKTFRNTGDGNFYIKDTRFSTAEEINNAYANGELEIIAKLQTPIETPVTETDFSAFRNIRTNKGATTILCEAEAEVDYYLNNPNAQAIGNIHDLVHFSYFKLKRAIIETGGSTL